MHNLSTLLHDIAKDLSEYGYTNSSVPTYLKTYLAGELLNVLPRAFVDRCFEIYFENKCRYVDCKFINGSDDNEVSFVFNDQIMGTNNNNRYQRGIYQNSYQLHRNGYQPSKTDHYKYDYTNIPPSKSPDIYKSPISTNRKPCLTCTSSESKNNSSKILSPKTNSIATNKVTRKIQMSSPTSLEKSTNSTRLSIENSENNNQIERGRPKIRPQTACFNLMQNTMASTTQNDEIPAKISKMDNNLEIKNTNKSAFTENLKFTNNNRVNMNVSPVESEAIEQAIEKAIVRNTDNMIMEEAIGKVLDKNRQLVKTKSLTGEENMTNGHVKYHHKNNDRRISSSPETASNNNNNNDRNYTLTSKLRETDNVMVYNLTCNLCDNYERIQTDRQFIISAYKAHRNKCAKLNSHDQSNGNIVVASKNIHGQKNNNKKINSLNVTLPLNVNSTIENE